MKRYIIFVPFFYLQQTRLHGLKDFAFHFLYEWLPAFLIIFYHLQSIEQSIIELTLFYVAFISIYELGYLLNDLQARKKPGERARIRPLTALEVGLFITVRLTAFLGVTLATDQLDEFGWWVWYGSLMLLFLGHNLIQNRSLRCISFSGLAFFRFFSPLWIITQTPLFGALWFPISVNYVLFRLFAYMDSKALLTGFNRKQASFRIGYYLIVLAICFPLTAITSSYLPVLVTSYFLVAAALGVVFSIISKSE